MIDIQLIRNNPDKVRSALKARNMRLELDELVKLDERRRELIIGIEGLQKQKNDANDEISILIKNKKDAKGTIAAMKDIAKKIDAMKPEANAIAAAIEEKLMLIPNIPSDDVPIGGPEANKVVKEAGEIKKFSFKPLDHIRLLEELDIVDFKRGSKISGSFFLLFKGDGARLERALISFMLDTHTKDHGYQEMSPPYLVKRSSMTGTGQLPKFEEDMYRVFRGSPELENGSPEDNDLFLIPTAEVPITNIHREEILDATRLPIRYTAYTPCFRLEAGSYGKDSRGMMRVHQFDKVELVKFVQPEDSVSEHEKLLNDAEKIFKLLGIPYRVLLLASGDLGFSACKCYDLEVWAPGMQKWLEASSCSNFTDFQARRAGIKYRDVATKKTRFVHTLNGSGVALARTFAAVVENFQQADGSILIPEVLRPYMNGQTHIKKQNL